jgi:hypothetical protein
MSYKSKIRMSVGWIYPITILCLYLTAIAEWVIRGQLRQMGQEVSSFPQVAIFLAAFFFTGMGVFQWFRYRNWIYPVLGILIGTMTAVFVWRYASDGESEVFLAIYMVAVILFFLLIILKWSTIYSHERFELNSRRLFRLAGERIFQTSDGYTERLYPGGNISYTHDELVGFVRFLHGNYVVRPFYHEKFIHLAFSMNKSLMVIHEPAEVSYITLDYQGRITVRISEKDYRDYTERLSFDQLCSSMAEVFIRFIGYYQKGLEARIISELKSAGNIFL